MAAEQQKAQQEAYEAYARQQEQARQQQFMDGLFGRFGGRRSGGGPGGRQQQQQQQRRPGASSRGQAAGPGPVIDVEWDTVDDK